MQKLFFYLPSKCLDVNVFSNVYFCIIDQITLNLKIFKFTLMAIYRSFSMQLK